MSALVRRAAALTALALTIPLGAAFGAPTGAGSAGIGDPYYPDYGNGGYDVSHYGIDIGYTPKTDTVAGSTTITATTTQTLSRFDLDFVLPVSTVTVNGARAAFREKPHELVVTPAKKLAAGADMTVRVTYAGVPSTISDGRIKPWIRTDDGAAAVGEPEIAAWWYPSNDHPRDKATYDVSVRVPRNLEVLGNGKLVSSDVRAGQRTWHWREDIPMASYLAFFVAGQFDITKSFTDDGLPVITAVASDGGSEGRFAAADLKRTPEVIDFEKGLWGPYPFDALGGVAPAADFGFALENQTRPVYTRSFWRSGPNIYVIVHEQAHQWYGDSVSVHNWRDIWLNEGFATFTEWLWSEKHGEGSAASLFAATYADHPATDSFLEAADRQPRSGPRVREPGLRPRCDDPAGAAHPDRGPGVLHRDAHLGLEPQAPQRLGAPVHQAGREGQRRRPRLLLRRLAVLRHAACRDGGQRVPGRLRRRGRLRAGPEVAGEDPGGRPDDLGAEPSRALTRTPGTGTPSPAPPVRPALGRAGAQPGLSTMSNRARVQESSTGRSIGVGVPAGCSAKSTTRESFTPKTASESRCSPPRTKMWVTNRCSRGGDHEVQVRRPHRASPGGVEQVADGAVVRDRVGRRGDCPEAVATLFVAVQVGASLAHLAGVLHVVPPLVVGLPHVEPGPGHGRSAGVADRAVDPARLAGGTNARCHRRRAPRGRLRRRTDRGRSPRSRSGPRAG